MHLHQAFYQRIFRRSQKPIVSVLSYMALLEAEISTIVTIIEGIRYGLAPTELRALISI